VVRVVWPVMALAFACINPVLALADTGEVNGLLTDDSGEVAVKTQVRLVRQFQVGWTGPWSAVTDTARDGRFRFEGVPEGSYVLCVPTAGSGFLDPCEWGQAAVFEVRSGQRAASRSLQVRRGFLLSLVVDDNAELLDEHETKKTPAAEFVIGVLAASQGIFRSAPPVRKTKKSREYALLVPKGQAVQLIVKSPFFKVADARGAEALKALGIRQEILVPANARPEEVPVRRLRITGLHP
jgi:hypothetical protein